MKTVNTIDKRKPLQKICDELNILYYRKFDAEHLMEFYHHIRNKNMEVKNG